jgi:hypothetical protein
MKEATFEEYKEGFEEGFSFEVGYAITIVKPEHIERLKAIYNRDEWEHLNGYEVGVYMGFSHFRDRYDEIVARETAVAESDTANYLDETQ